MAVMESTRAGPMAMSPPTRGKAKSRAALASASKRASAWAYSAGRVAAARGGARILTANILPVVLDHGRHRRVESLDELSINRGAIGACTGELAARLAPELLSMHSGDAVRWRIEAGEQLFVNRFTSRAG